MTYLKILETPHSYTERDVMRAFKEKWENKMGIIHKEMASEAKKLGYKIDGNYGGVHYSHSWAVMPSRIELKVIL